MVKIAVAGGTGLVGRQTVEAVRCHGHDPLVLTRSAGVDLTTGAGLAAPLDGADAVIDVTNTPGVDASQVRAFFATVGGTCWPPSTPRSSAIMWCCRSSVWTRSQTRATTPASGSRSG